MKLLYIANERIPTDRANGLQIMKTCEAFAKNGIGVELFLPNRKTWAMNEDPFEYYRVDPVFTIRKIPCIDLIPYLSFLGPVPYWLIAVSFSLSAVFYAASRKRDILYFRHDPILFWFLIFFRRNCVGEFHFLARKAYQRFFHRLKLVVVINRAAKEKYDAITGVKEKVVWAPDGVSVEDFDIKLSQSQARLRLGIGEKDRIVVYTGHFYRWKGIDTLIKAASLLPKNILVLLVGGETPQDSPLSKENLPSNIKKVGQKKYAEVPVYLKAADVLVLTGTKKDDRSNLYTSPLKLFEYMASGSPIVASDTAAIREVLEHKKNAWLVSADDARALSDGIMNMLGDYKLNAALAAQARKDVENYSWEKRAVRIIQAVIAE